MYIHRVGSSPRLGLDDLGSKPKSDLSQKKNKKNGERDMHGVCCEEQRRVLVHAANGGGAHRKKGTEWEKTQSGQMLLVLAQIICGEFLQ